MRAAILMSTFQGEKYVKSQIESILQQLPPEGQLIIRDDGSNDRTVSIIREIPDLRITLIEGENIGFAASFFSLMEKAPKDAEMIMLSDQDDIWLPGKIQRAWEIIRTSQTEPLLYCSRQQLVDAELNPIGVSKKWPQKPSFKNALMENIATGCTIAMNTKACLLSSQTGNIKKIYFHDWWIYLVISAFGHVHFDEEPTILYRQHGNNVVGRGNGLKRYLENIAFIRRRSWVHILFSQLENFKQTWHSALSSQNQKIFLQCPDPNALRSVCLFFLKPQRFRQFYIDDFLLRALVAAEIFLGRGLLPKS